MPLSLQLYSNERSIARKYPPQDTPRDKIECATGYANTHAPSNILERIKSSADRAKVILLLLNPRFD